VFGLEKVDQKPYNSSIKPMETIQRDHEKLARSSNLSRGKNRLFHYPPKACGELCSTFWRSGAL